MSEVSDSKSPKAKKEEGKSTTKEAVKKALSAVGGESDNDAQKSSGKPEPEGRALLYILMRASFVVFAVSTVVVLFAGWKALGQPISPSALPAVLSGHVANGQYLPVFDGQRSLNVFVSRVGFKDYSEETVLLLHSLPESSLSFQTVQEKLAAKGLSSLAYDYPGFGMSDKPHDVAYSVEYLVDTAKEVLTTLHVDHVHLVAEGNGCPVAAEFVRKYPYFVSSVLLWRCEPLQSGAPNLVSFLLEHSPALPSLLRKWIFGDREHLESDVAAANRMLTLHKGGHVSYFSFLNSVGEKGVPAVSIKDAAFKEVCRETNCVDATGKDLSSLIAKFVQGLPADYKQKKAARAPPRVIYTKPGQDKYGLGAHEHAHDHAHVSHDQNSGATPQKHHDDGHSHEGHSHEDHDHHDHDGHEHGHDDHSGHDHEHSH